MEKMAFAFQFDGRPVLCTLCESGHINTTFTLETDKGARYILQKVNRQVFRDVPALMNNIQAVTSHLQKKEPDERRVMRLVPALDGASYALDEQGEYWRAFVFVRDSVCLETAKTAEEFYESGVAFGRFQSLLSDFPADELSETIPGFHDTAARYRKFHEVLSADPVHRAREVKPEIDFYLAREEEAGIMVGMQKSGLLPLRVTHNDTKLNNVLLDELTHEPLCVIDLDTVMPGLCGNDFGDSIRFGASTALEDERDLSRVSLSLPLFEAYAKGFLSACGKSLTPLELETLPLAAKLITLECGLRFLTDYLEGDVYFRIHRPGHNLDRSRTQLQLVLDMERKFKEMQTIIQLWKEEYTC
jgi:Ser/Thr protein kinase RdoA (MazF antagonist)